jgi:hypothetical protein
MDIVKMLSDLRSERERLQEAIVVMERFAAGSGRRRGRPPKWMSKANSPEPSPRKRTVSAEGRKRMAAAQKRRWAAARKTQSA